MSSHGDNIKGKPGYSAVQLHFPQWDTSVTLLDILRCTLGLTLSLTVSKASFPEARWVLQEPGPRIAMAAIFLEVFLFLQLGFSFSF